MQIVEAALPSLVLVLAIAVIVVLARHLLNRGDRRSS
jgi:hypothetical protein